MIKYAQNDLLISSYIAVILLCTEDDNSSYRNVCKMSVVSFALAVIFIIRLFSTSVFRVPKFLHKI